MFPLHGQHMEPLSEHRSSWNSCPACRECCSRPTTNPIHRSSSLVISTCLSGGAKRFQSLWKRHKPILCLCWEQGRGCFSWRGWGSRTQQDPTDDGAGAPQDLWDDGSEPQQDPLESWSRNPWDVGAGPSRNPWDDGAGTPGMMGQDPLDNGAEPQQDPFGMMEQEPLG